MCRKDRGGGQSDTNANSPVDDAVLQREDSVMMAKDRLGQANDSITVAKGREIRQIVDETIRKNSQPGTNVHSEASQQHSAGTSSPEAGQNAASRNETGAGKCMSSSFLFPVIPAASCR